MSFDAAGHITNIDKSGLITESNLVQMFAEKTASDGYVKKSYIAAFVTELPDGRFQSNALVSADQIRLEGIVTANSYFKILENGAIEAISGTIGGIKITNEGLGSYISGWHPIDIPAMKLSNSGLHFLRVFSIIMQEGHNSHLTMWILVQTDFLSPWRIPPADVFMM